MGLIPDGQARGKMGRCDGLADDDDFLPSNRDHEPQGEESPDRPGQVPQGDAHGDYSEFQRPSVVRKATRQVFLVQTELLDKIAELVG